MDGLQLEKLYVLIEAQTADFNNEMNKVNSRIDTMTSTVNKATTKGAKSFSTFGKTIVAAFSVGALIGFFNKFLEITKQTESFKKTLAEAFEPITLMAQPILNELLIRIAQTAAWISGVVQAMTKWTGATKAQTAAAEAQKRAYAGFDELNVVPSDTSTSTAAVEPLINTAEYIEAGKKAWEKYGDTVKAVLLLIGAALSVGLISKLIALGKTFATVISTYIMKSWKEVWDATKAGVAELGTVLSKVMWFFKEMGLVKLGLYIGIAIGLLMAFFDLYKTNYKGFADFINGIVIVFKDLAALFVMSLAPITITIVELIKALWGQLVILYEQALKPVLDIFFRVAAILLTIAGGTILGALSIALNIIGAVISGIVAVLLMAVTLFNQFIDAIIKGNPLAIGFATLIGLVLVPYLWSMVTALAASTIGMVKQVIQWGLSTAALIANKAATIATTVAQWALNAALNANPIGLVVLAIAALVAAFVWAYQNVDWFREGIDKLWDFLKDFASGLWDTFKGLFNGIAELWNNSLGSWSIDIPKWVPLIGGKKFSMPVIPYLEDGGSLNAGSLFVAGESGAELIGSYNNQTTVMPLENSNFTSAMKAAVISGVIEGIAASSNGNSTTTLVVDGMTLAKAVETNLNKLSTIQGGLKIAM